MTNALVVKHSALTVTSLNHKLVSKMSFVLYTTYLPMASQALRRPLQLHQHQHFLQLPHLHPSRFQALSSHP